MSPEPSAWLRAHAAALGINPKSISQASASLTLGPVITKISNNASRTDYTLEHGQRFILRPHNLYLAHSAELLTCPETHVWQLSMRLELALMGLGFLSPQFSTSSGQLAFGMYAVVPLEIRGGQPIAQVSYQRLNAFPERTEGVC